MDFSNPFRRREAVRPERTWRLSRSDLVTALACCAAVAARLHARHLYALDIPALGGDDLRKFPLHLRENSLDRVLARRPEGILVSEFEQGEIGPDLFRQACKSKKAPPPGKRYFLATMDEKLIKDLKQAGIADDKSASECLEIAARQWLDRRELGNKKG